MRQQASGGYPSTPSSQPPCCRFARPPSPLATLFRDRPLCRTPPPRRSDMQAPSSSLREAAANSNMNGEEVTGIMEVIAATGKFWHDWDTLKSLLSFRLKQALAEYPESQMDGGIGAQEGSLPGETYPELVKRLDEALLSFTEGPPFTLQRFCEILLAPKNIYPKLLKLAVALEKNLLVTSTLTKCTEPYPIKGAQQLLEAGTTDQQIQESSHPVLGGVDSAVTDVDEEMAEAEANADSTNIDTKVQEDKLSGDDESGTDDHKSDPLCEACPSSEE